MQWLFHALSLSLLVSPTAGGHTLTRTPISDRHTFESDCSSGCTVHTTAHLWELKCARSDRTTAPIIRVQYSLFNTSFHAHRHGVAGETIALARTTQTHTYTHRRVHTEFYTLIHTHTRTQVKLKGAGGVGGGALGERIEGQGGCYSALYCIHLHLWHCTQYCDQPRNVYAQYICQFDDVSVQ